MTVRMRGGLITAQGTRGFSRQSSLAWWDSRSELGRAFVFRFYRVPFLGGGASWHLLYQFQSAARVFSFAPSCVGDLSGAFLNRGPWKDLLRYSWTGVGMLTGEEGLRLPRLLSDLRDRMRVCLCLRSRWYGGACEKGSFLVICTLEIVSVELVLMMILRSCWHRFGVMMTRKKKERGRTEYG